MTCDTVREQLGAYVDGEVGPPLRAAIQTHVTECHDCAVQLAALSDLAGALSDAGTVAVPVTLWQTIEERLRAHPKRRILTLPIARLAGVAAAVVLLIGLGLFSLPWGGNGIPRAQATTVDFGVLLDGLRFDARAAFDKFVALYQGRPATVAEARRHGKDLSFDIPETLPGGFKLATVYTLKFGAKPGVAVCYLRDNQFLAAIFHEPVLEEQYGTHEDRECVVGSHRGHAVEVGDWRLIHVTDPSTCHCVLSTLDESTELPPILAALAPGSRGHGSLQHGDGHGRRKP